jgi:hypothetical protein
MPSIANAPERLPATLIELTIWSRRMPKLFLVFLGWGIRSSSSGTTSNTVKITENAQKPA